MTVTGDVEENITPEASLFLPDVETCTLQVRSERTRESRTLMTEPTSPNTRRDLGQREPRADWGSQLIQHVLYPFALVGAPVFLAGFLVYLVAQSFADSADDGIRSFASVLLPLMGVTFLLTFRRDEASEQAEKVPLWLAFVATFVIGMIAVQLLSVSTTAPIAELILSASFSILVFSYVSLERQKMFAYYFGMVIGFLTFVVLFGFPAVG